MLLKSENNIKLQKDMQKILCFSSAYNGTFVASRVDHPGVDQSIVHFGADGKIISEFNYPDIINQFGQLNDKEVIVMDHPKNKIDIINLQTKKTFSINHQYLFDDLAQITVETFSETRFFCIQEKGSFNDHRLKLTYYAYDGLNEQSVPVAEWQSQENQWTYEHPIRRANNHSKIAWWLLKHDAEVLFHFFDLKDDPKGKFQTVKAANTLGNAYGINNLQLTLGAVWETKPNQYMLTCHSNKVEHKAVNKNGVINNIYILDASLGNDKGTLRETKFDFKRKNDDFSWNDQVIEFFNLGPISVFHTYRHEKGEVLQTPVFYINNDTEQIIAQQTWKAICYHNFFIPGWDNATIVEGYYDNGEVKEIKAWVKKVMDPKEISLHFLLHLNEDFDDDLLNDAISLLHDK